ncbi:MAG: 4-hydroxy-3-polyprenylbenzoate decarboxylase [Desulfonauticus sp.]|jgi:4-hydroxy-3-polyprenylbenzoate decarboxylase|nr:MAG: Carboxylyase-related protein [Desulfonauticus sp. 38_4375]MDK2921661.1 4-hydroxy-3-polyprenylbenzoate decarboxylase [Desulfonauticus sp.]
MGIKNTRELVHLLESKGELVRVKEEVDAQLEIAAIQRRVFQRQGPALLFERVKNCAYPLLGNIFGSKKRLKLIFADTLAQVESLFKLKIDPLEIFKKPHYWWTLPRALKNTWPKMVKKGPILKHKIRISALPRLKSWPRDGGAYITLPQVYTESPFKPGLKNSNLGMYRVQLDGNEYLLDQEVGLHYQIHRGIGVHHQQALHLGQKLPVNIFVGGPPAMTLAAIMPLPEGIAEIFFAGVLGGQRIKLVKTPEHPLPLLAEADFCICGYIDGVKPEGPFGDHLGYYSLKHPFPVLKVTGVYARPQPIWPFTTVGRPPQEDTLFGEFIHELTKDLVPTVFTGVKQIHAVDAAGVHPLLLAVGRESYVPFSTERIPQEILTQAFSLLGQTQTSLSKYLFIQAEEKGEALDVYNIPNYFQTFLERLDLRRDLHFITRTTMDTLDYTGISLNQGSKLILAACAPKKRELGQAEEAQFKLPEPFGKLTFFAPGILILQGPGHTLPRDEQDPVLRELANYLFTQKNIEKFPLLVVVNDALFTAKNWENFLWVTFTRSDPATDIYGVGEFTHCKHFGAQKAIIIDSRLKGYHAPPLEEDPAVLKRIQKLGEKGKSLYKIL